MGAKDRLSIAHLIKNTSISLHYFLVRETGLEPARRKAYAPKAYVYTNFTTRAKTVKVTTTILTKSHPNINSA